MHYSFSCPYDDLDEEKDLELAKAIRAQAKWSDVKKLLRLP